ncbi:hypothetical protein VS893_24555, partial [Shigella flexneri]|nr:hypothetical protein [Shigella flexneri]
PAPALSSGIKIFLRGMSGCVFLIFLNYISGLGCHYAIASIQRIAVQVKPSRWHSSKRSPLFPAPALSSGIKIFLRGMSGCVFLIFLNYISGLGC